MPSQEIPEAAHGKPEGDERLNDVHDGDEARAEIQAEGSSSSSGPTKKCAHCSTPETDPEKPLKPCSKCQTIRYCSRDCQKNDWKQHKKTCAAFAQIHAQTADLKPTAAPRVPKETHRGGLQKWQFDT